MIFNFEKLVVWQLAEDLAVEVYKLFVKFPQEEKYGLCSQLRRAVSSISINLAEGSGRSSYQEKIRFIEISDGSLKETYSELHLSMRLGFITEEDLEQLQPLFVDIESKLRALRWSYKKQLEEGNKQPMPSDI